MKLTPSQEAMLAGEQGETLARCLQTLVRYGAFYEAQRLVPVESAHLVLSGGSRLFATYLEILHALVAEGQQFAVPTTLNPHYTTQPPSFLERLVFSRDKQFQADFRALGGVENYSCTPYLGASVPARGDVLAWAESNAVIYVNSVIGARTNRNSGIVDLCSAVTGFTPETGLLLPEHRRADWVVKLALDPEVPVDYPVVGYAIGERVLDGVPFLRGLPGQPRHADFKNMGAAMAAAGGVGLYHVEGLTPEARDAGEDLLRPDARRVTLSQADLDAVRRRLAEDRTRHGINLVFMGCPHLTYEELAALAARFGTHPVQVRTWLNAAPEVVARFRREGMPTEFARTGVELVSLCPITLFNAPALRKRRILTNSGKMRYYAPCYYGTTAECVAVATGGTLS